MYAENQASPSSSAGGGEGKSIGPWVYILGGFLAGAVVVLAITLPIFFTRDNVNAAAAADNNKEAPPPPPSISTDDVASPGTMSAESVEAVRAALKRFVDSLDDSPDLRPSRLERGYHGDANDQGRNYHICTVVQQCLDPPFILSLGHMGARSRGLAFDALGLVMSQESFNMLQLQEHSDMLLGEMQDWASTCPGTCRVLDDPDGLLDVVPEGAGSLADESTEIADVDYHACGDKRANDTYTIWYCDDEPRMVHQADIDVSSGKYKLGNIWRVPHTHGRNLQYSYFSAYGDLEPNGGGFGLRYSAHHIDLNYRWDDEGHLVQDLPVFLGHNPLIVPSTVPPTQRAPDERHSDGFHPLMWTNMAGIAQFAESERLVLNVANELLSIAPGSYIPLDNWASTGYIGAFQLAEGKEVDDYEYFDLSTASESDFEMMWSLVEYTIKFSRGHRPTIAEKAIFRSEGKAVWTTTNPAEEGLPMTQEDFRSNLNFLNLRIETKDLLFFVMVNQLFTVISENEPTNHLHSILIPKELITADNSCMKTDDPLCAAPPREDDENDAHDHGQDEGPV